MAERGETIREMLQGFNAMQAQLGLLPPTTNASPLGVSLPQPLPPPQVLHPGQTSQAAFQASMGMSQQTLGASQQIRYTPPPTMATSMSMNPGLLGSSLGAISGSQLSPYAANFMGGGTMAIPSPIYNTGSQFGMYRPQSPGLPSMPLGFSQPSVFNPLAPNFAGPQFMMPSAYQGALQSTYASQGASLAVGGFRGLAGAAGSYLGGALGQATIPIPYIGSALGSFAGQMLGNTVGRVGEFMARPYLQEVGMANAISGISRNYMTGGAFLGPGGAGFDMDSARQISRGFIGLGRDQGLQRELGFNTADYSKIYGMASQQGMLDFNQNPQQTIDSVKNIAKSVKAFMQLASEPDIREAMRMMGQMRNMGFNLAETNSAMFNARQFARMAGVTVQQGFNMYGQPGAMMAQQVGLSGGLGFNAGMGGAAAARMGISGGAFNEQQLSLAGGMQGLAQINATSGIAAVNMDALLPGLLKNQGGRLSIDQNLVRQFQSGQFSMRSVMQRGAQNMRDWGQMGIENITVQLQEQKDNLGRALGPQGTQMWALRQALDIKRETGGTLGGAFMKLGYSQEQARALELQYTSSGFWNNQIQQTEQEGRDEFSRQQSKWAQYTTPGLGQAIRGGIRGAINSVGDMAAAPFRAVGDFASSTMEEIHAANRGQQIYRFSNDALIQSSGEMSRIQRFAKSGGYGRALERMGVSGRQNDESNVFDLGIGRLATGVNSAVVGHSMTDDGVAAAASTMRRYDALSNTDYRNMTSDLSSKAGIAGGSSFNFDDAAEAAASSLLSNLKNKHGSTIDGAIAADETDFKQAWITALTANGMSRDKAEQYYAANADNLKSVQLKKALPYATKKQKEVLYKSIPAADKAAAKAGINVATLGDVKAARNKVLSDMGAQAYTKEFDVAISKFSGDSDAIAYAALSRAAKTAGTKERRAAAEKAFQEFRHGLGGRAKDVEQRASEVAAGLSESELGGLAKAAISISTHGGDVSKVIGQYQESSDVYKATVSIGGYLAQHQDVGAFAKLSKSGRFASKEAMISALKDVSTTDLEMMGDTDMAKAIKLIRAGKTEEGYNLATSTMITEGNVTKKTTVGGSYRTAEMTRRQGQLEQMRDEALASGDLSTATTATLAGAADKLDSAADKLLELTGKHELKGLMPKNWFGGE